MWMNDVKIRGINAEIKLAFLLFFGYLLAAIDIICTQINTVEFFENIPKFP